MTLVDALRSVSSDAALVYDTFNAASAAGFLFDNAAAFCGAGIVVGPAHVQAAEAPGLAAGAVVAAEEKQATSAPPRRKRRRRARSCKPREQTESQRMTHIAVERNRRRLMNDYLAVLRSLMPESYVQRNRKAMPEQLARMVKECLLGPKRPAITTKELMGDQASIVGGAIEFVKELEQQLQSLEAQKRTLVHQHKAKCDAMPMHTSSTNTTTCMESTSNCSSSVTEDASDAPPFRQFFTYPQYVWCHSPRDSTAASAMLPAENQSGVADIEVNLVETHANVRIMSPRRPGQLLKLVAGLQALRFTVLHLNVTALDSLVLYSLSVKVEEGCSLTTVDDIAAAVHHVLSIIDAEVTSQQLLAVGQ